MDNCHEMSGKSYCFVVYLVLYIGCYSLQYFYVTFLVIFGFFWRVFLANGHFLYLFWSVLLFFMQFISLSSDSFSSPLPLTISLLLSLSLYLPLSFPCLVLFLSLSFPLSLFLYCSYFISLSLSLTLSASSTRFFRLCFIRPINAKSNIIRHGHRYRNKIT